MRRSTPRAMALKSPALTAPPPTSSWPTPRGAIMSAADRNGTHSIVLVGVLLELVQQGAVVLIGGARAELIVGILDPGLQERDGAAEVVRDHLQRREAIEQPAEDHPRHGDRRIEGPSENVPDLVQ